MYKLGENDNGQNFNQKNILQGRVAKSIKVVLNKDMIKLIKRIRIKIKL